MHAKKNKSIIWHGMTSAAIIDFIYLCIEIVFMQWIISICFVYNSNEEVYLINGKIYKTFENLDKTNCKEQILQSLKRKNICKKLKSHFISLSP